MLGIWFPGRLLVPAAEPLISTEKTEAFDFYQDGKSGSGQRVTVKLNLGQDVTMEFVRIRAGKFVMGSPPSEKDRLVDEVQHPVDITRDFYMGKFEVTRGQFRAFVKDTGYKTEPETDGRGGWGYNKDTGKVEGRKYGEPAEKPAGQAKYTWRSAGFDQTDEYPVVNVTWNDADAFCHWLAQRIKQTVRLPTEAEWEYACRAGSTTRFYTGDDPEGLVKVGNVADGTAKKKFPDWDSTVAAEDGYVFSSPVGTFLANSFGLYDMHGNAWEWCQDWYGPYADLSAQNPVREDPLKQIPGHVIRGGGFGKRTPQICSAAHRMAGAPSSRDLDLGFRVVYRPD